MSTNEDQNAPQEDEGNAPLNPYAAPIQDQRFAAHSLGDVDGEVDLARVNGQAKWYIATGLLLAVALIGLSLVGIFVATLLIAVLQFAWVYPALRHSSKYAKYLSTEVRVGLRILLVFHCLILALATIVALLLFTCIAIFTATGN